MLEYGAAALSTVADRVSALSLDTAAELSRMQAERFKTLSNLAVRAHCNYERQPAIRKSAQTV